MDTTMKKKNFYVEDYIAGFEKLKVDDAKVDDAKVDDAKVDDAKVTRKIRIIRNVQKPDNIEKLSIIEITRKYPPPTWKDVFKEADDELELISELLGDKEKVDGTFFPRKADLFKAFELCPRNSVKVVIFGQDPYHQMLYTGEPRAQGLSFSVGRTDVIPSSLQNIFKEIKSDVGIDNYSHGDLSCWAKQGILLLNTCLTVQPNQAGSHKHVWAGFIDKVIKDIAQANQDCIYVLWGNVAKKLSSSIEGSPPILESSHPSGFSYTRGFKGCCHFSQINEILRNQGRTEIDWSVR